MEDCVTLLCQCLQLVALTYSLSIKSLILAEFGSYKQIRALIGVPLECIFIKDIYTP